MINHKSCSDYPNSYIPKDKIHCFLDNYVRSEEELQEYYKIALVWREWFSKTNILHEVDINSNGDILQIYKHMVHNTSYGLEWCCK